MERLSVLYRSLYGRLPDSIVPLSGSASNRRYFRLASGPVTCIGVIGLDVLENKAFLTIGRHLRAKGISVPEILAVSEDMMCYLQEDLGDRLLSDSVEEAMKSGGIRDDGPLAELLCRVISLLPEIQFKGAQGLDFSECYPQPSFDRRMIMFDLNYFKYCFLKPSGLEFNEVLLQDDYERFADSLLMYDTDTFLYRDFNARNVMIRDGVPFFIDFQGGRRGPIYYDVASFVWQARAGYSARMKDKLLESYLGALSRYIDVSREEFESGLKLFVLFRLMQVLGAYGFRGWQEGKAAFVVSIIPAIRMLKEHLHTIPSDYPYLIDTLRRLTELPRFGPDRFDDGRLVVEVCSFSYKKGLPRNDSGNGGGYVFDCRSIHNPGRYEPYKKLTGRDEPVIRFLEEDGEVFRFMENVYGLVDPHVEVYCRRGFTHLTISFGCTGGRHRSVYCAEHMASHLKERFPDIHVQLLHREQPLLNNI